MDIFILIMIIIYRFCIGDRFHLYDNRILCEYDYEEMLVFSNNGGNNPNTAINNSNKLSVNNNHLEKLVKQTESTLASFSSSSSSSSSSNTGLSVSTAGIAGTSTTQSNNQPAARQAAVNPSSNQADDGSSGYGSPDSLLSDGR